MVVTGEVRALFASQPLICALDDNTIDEIAGFSHYQRFPPGTILFREGDIPSLLFIVADGLVAARRRDGGVTTTISISGAGTVMPVGPIVSDWHCVLSVEVIAPSQIFMVPALTVRALAEKSPAFAFAVAVELATGYRKMIGQMSLQKTTPATERLAAWLLANANSDGVVDLKFSRAELASLLGMSPESMARGIQALSEQGLDASRAGLRVADRQMMGQFLTWSPSSAVA